jgi:glycerophosphoryl diester phosphodiesterase
MRHENTLRGIRDALDAGARVDGAEVDLQLSADGQVFVFHDTSLRRLAGHEVRARDLSWAQLEQLTLHCGEKIPRVEELLEMWPAQLTLNLELKDGGPELVAALAPVLASYALEDVVISSFDAIMINAAGMLPWPRAMLVAQDSPAWIHAEGAKTLGCAWVHLQASLYTEVLARRYAAEGTEIGIWGARSAQAEEELAARGVPRIISDFRVDAAQ